MGKALFYVPTGSFVMQVPFAFKLLLSGCHHPSEDFCTLAKIFHLHCFVRIVAAIFIANKDH